MQQNLHIHNTMYVTPILLLLLASNVFAGGNEDWQALFSNVGINTKETSCEVQNFKINLDSLLNMAHGQQKENAPELTPLIEDCPKYPKYHTSNTQKETFSGALESCRKFMMRLATLDTHEKFRCLKNLLRLSDSTEDYWIAASNQNSPYFKWETTGQDATDILKGNWPPGYPRGIPNVCVSINALTGLVRDFDCSIRRNYVCEEN